jgi:DNA phosphorothioation-associated putative methyltransferase
MLPETHAGRDRLVAVTRLAESIGLFEDPTRIGFRNQWVNLVSSKGYEVVGQELVPKGNTSTEVIEDMGNIPIPDAAAVLRHLTALSRNFLSAPVQALLRHGVLTQQRTFFDYGCGKGDDLRGIESLGIQSGGWDPHFRPDAHRAPADVVNLGFVINVIERVDERIEALQRAFALTKGTLSVAAMLWSSSSNRTRPLGDGFLSSRNTFQRYYTQAELQSFIEGMLDEQAFPIGPGIFFVFRDRHVEQQFLLGRQTDSSRARRLLAARPATPRIPKPVRRPVTAHKDPAHRAAAESLWSRLLALGRLPEEDEYLHAEQAVHLFGSWPRALRAATRHGDADLLVDAGRARSDEIRVFFAIQAFSRRKQLRDLEPRLRRDIKAFFGSLGVAEAEGRRLLYECADVELIEKACERASAHGLGYLVTGHSLQLHCSLVPRLDPILRVYVACATTLYGDVGNADLVKIHIQSGKLSLMRFDAFEERPLPRMIERIKLRLREQDLDFFEYGVEHPPPLLYFKSRYINEEFPSYPEQLEFDQQLEDLAIVEPESYGPSEAGFRKSLRAMRREISGMILRRGTDVPSLDEPCGRVFTYRQFVECGETWERTRCDNVPRRPETYNALYDLAASVLDPVVEYFGAVKLTYGFSSPALTQAIAGRIAPKLDQHAGCELGRGGRMICPRGGAAIDFLVEYEDMLEVARWIAANCKFDRLYVYGSDRPIHVSLGPDLAGEIYELTAKGNRRVPRRLVLSRS